MGGEGLGEAGVGELVEGRWGLPDLGGLQAIHPASASPARCVDVGGGMRARRALCDFRAASHIHRGRAGHCSRNACVSHFDWCVRPGKQEHGQVMGPPYLPGTPVLPQPAPPACPFS